MSDVMTLKYGSDVPIEQVLEEARALVPALLVWLENRTGRDPLVAVAALTMASRAIVGATEHCMETDAAERERFQSDVGVVKERSE